MNSCFVVDCGEIVRTQSVASKSIPQGLKARIWNCALSGRKTLLQAACGRTFCAINLCTVLINLMAARAINIHSERIEDCIPNHITDRLFSMVECGLKCLRLSRYQQHYEDRKLHRADRCDCHSYGVAEEKRAKPLCSHFMLLFCFYTGYTVSHRCG